MTAMKEKKAKKTVDYNSDENILAMYLREINRIPLLTKEEEDQAARRAAEGDKAAREKLISGNLRFVINVAKRYQGQGLPLADLISEGNVGLMNAVDRFDVSMGYRFISYAVWWIRQSIFKALCEKGRMIRLPSNRTSELIQIEKARKMLHGQYNGDREIQEIAALLDMDKDHVEDMVAIARDIISLENAVYQGKDSSVLGDFLEDERYPLPDQKAENGALKEEIENLLETLDSKEAAVIRCRYGLGQNIPMTLKEIGDRYNLTKERIRQIEKAALARLQHPARKSRLVDYVA